VSPRPSAPARAGLLVLGVAILAIASAYPLYQYLLTFSDEDWQIDLAVYREASRALLNGLAVYDLRTDAPQFLPFTYPPVAAIFGLPLLLVPFRVLGWIWSVLQLVLLWYTVGIAFRPLLERFGRWWPVAQGAIGAVAIWMLPVSDGIRFGQVNAIVVALCLADLARRGEPRRWARGSLVGLAVAVKLTPGVFWLHWAAVRRWKVLLTSVLTTVAVTLLAALVMPEASVSFWLGALSDTSRVGPNSGTSNQSLNGLLLRTGIPAQGLFWGLAAIAVLAGGLWLSRRLDTLDEPVAVVAAVGLTAFLVSPVSWVHHLYWGLILVAALAGDGRDRRRLVAAGVFVVLLWIHVPWWGVAIIDDLKPGPHWLGYLMQNGYTITALAGLACLAWLVARRPVDRTVAPAAERRVEPALDAR
jgi:alpha-1,2-mannosyltransferase